PEEAVEAYVDARGLDHRGVVGVEHDPGRVELGTDVTVGEQHDSHRTSVAGCVCGTSRGGPFPFCETWGYDRDEPVWERFHTCTRGREATMRYGHFDDEAREYVITTPHTPYPWINYLGSQEFFSLISHQAG